MWKAGKVAICAIVSILERELVLLLFGEQALELAADVLGVVCLDVSSLKPRPGLKDVYYTTV